MKHPTNEDWMDFLYGETDPEKRQAWERHRTECPECQGLLASWTRTQVQLNQWSPKTSQPPINDRHTPFLWKAPAVLLIGISFFLGHRSGSTALDKEALLAELSTQIRTEIQSTLETHPSFVAIEEAQPTQEWIEIRHDLENLFKNQTLQSTAAITQLREETSALLERFHTQLETVALVAEGRYQRSQNQLSSLGVLSQYQATPFAVQHNLTR